MELRTCEGSASEYNRLIHECAASLKLGSRACVLHEFRIVVLPCLLHNLAQKVLVSQLRRWGISPEFVPHIDSNSEVWGATEPYARAFLRTHDGFVANNSILRRSLVYFGFIMDDWTSGAGEIDIGLPRASVP